MTALRSSKGNILEETGLKTSSTSWPNSPNKLGNMMKDISKAAGLSKIYTNHCVRATAKTLWSNAGVPNRHIMAISGPFASEQSLAHYNSRPSSSQLLTAAKSFLEQWRRNQQMLWFQVHINPGIWKRVNRRQFICSHLVTSVCSTSVSLTTCRLSSKPTKTCIKRFPE